MCDEEYFVRYYDDDVDYDDPNIHGRIEVYNEDVEEYLTSVIHQFMEKEYDINGDASEGYWEQDDDEDMNGARYDAYTTAIRDFYWKLRHIKEKYKKDE